MCNGNLVNNLPARRLEMSNLPPLHQSLPPEA